MAVPMVALLAVSKAVSRVDLMEAVKGFQMVESMAVSTAEWMVA